MICTLFVHGFIRLHKQGAVAAAVLRRSRPGCSALYSHTQLELAAPYISRYGISTGLSDNDHQPAGLLWQGIADWHLPHP